MVRVKLVSKYPISYAIDREKVEVTADGRSGFVSVTSRADIASDKFVIESDYVNVESEVAFGKKIPVDGLIAEYTFFEGTGTVLHETLNGYDGTIYGAKWEQTATGKYCLAFDGTDDYVATQLTTSELANLVKHEVSVIAWIYPTQLGSVQIVADVSWNCPFSLRLNPAGKVWFEIRYASDDTYEMFVSDLYASEKEWQMIGGSVSLKNKKVIICKNTDFWSSNTSRGTEDTLKVSGSFRISGSPTNTYMFKGKVGLVYVYNKFLTEKDFERVFSFTAPLFGIKV